LELKREIIVDEQKEQTKKQNLGNNNSSRNSLLNSSNYSDSIYNISAPTLQNKKR